jgi:hypothetical protein
VLSEQTSRRLRILIEPGQRIMLDDAVAVDRIREFQTENPVTPSAKCHAIGFVLLVFFAFNKQAFCNYYFLVANCS